MDTLISVIVPVYNVENELPKCLDSIVMQTYPNLEILLINDGSTDSSGDICDCYASRDSRIKVMHKDNGGVSSARNLGLEIYSGEYAMFVDSDDYLSANAIECLYSRIRLDGSELAIGRTVNVYDNGTYLYPYSSLENDVVLTKHEALSWVGTERDLPCYLNGKLYSRSALNGIIIPPIRYGEDVWVFPHIIDNCKKISIVSDLIYYYVQRASSVVHTAKDEQILENITAVLHVAEFFLQRGMNKNAQGYYFSALFQAMRVKDRKKARELIVNAVDRENKKALLRNNIRARIRWISLYVPCVYESVQILKRIIRKNTVP